MLVIIHLQHGLRWWCTVQLIPNWMQNHSESKSPQGIWAYNWAQRHFSARLMAVQPTNFLLHEYTVLTRSWWRDIQQPIYTFSYMDKNIHALVKKSHFRCTIVWIILTSPPSFVISFYATLPSILGYCTFRKYIRNDFPSFSYLWNTLSMQTGSQHSALTATTHLLLII